MVDVDGAPTLQRYSAQRVFGSLDGIRCFSILAVLWHHTKNDVPWWPATARGFLGVDMFFVLSGFLIVTLLLRERDRRGIRLGRFYARRSLRIFPLYYATLLAVLLLCWFVPSKSLEWEPYLAMLPFLMTYTIDFVSQQPQIMELAWSLAAEEQFYFVWPPLERFLGRFFIPLWLAAMVFNQLINFRFLEDALLSIGIVQNELPILQITFTPILLGVGLAHALHNKGSFDRVAAIVGARFAPVWTLAGVIVVSNLPAEDILGWQRLGIQIFMTLFLAACVVREDHVLAGFLQNRVAVRLGQISYGMYLLHMIPVVFAGGLLKRAGLENVPGLLLLVSGVATYGLAELSFRFFETPFLRFKHRFAS